MIRHMFAGANTPEGFVGFFNEILLLDKTEKAVILKGSSGSGKSTFMKKFGKVYEDKGCDVEYIHCSNDADSLDGVCVPGLRIYVVDGTAPHAIDPVIPAGVEQIFNMGEFVDEKEIRSQKSELIELVREKTEVQKRVGNYLKAAKNVYNNNAIIYDRALNKVALNARIAEESTAFKGLTALNKVGRNRHAFASAITPQGLKSFIDELSCGKVKVLNAKDGMGADVLLADIQIAANRLGYDTESFYCPMKPSKTEHLIIPEQGLCYITANKYHKPSAQAESEVNFEELCEMPKGDSGEIEFNDGMFESLLKKTIDTMRVSLGLHEQIEKIYIAAIDFKKLDAACQNILDCC